MGEPPNWREIAPINRRLDGFRLYSQKYQVSGITDFFILINYLASRFGSLEAASNNITEIARQDRQLAGGLTMTLPFMFGWIEHR
jgi:hypothetical protein